jgi:hypothetical protein
MREGFFHSHEQASVLGIFTRAGCFHLQMGQTRVRRMLKREN